MIMYLCIKYQSNTLIFSSDIKLKPFYIHTDRAIKLKKVHNSHNNWWILPKNELDLYFMIIYLCVKYESNNSIFSKDMENIFPIYRRDDEVAKRAVTPIMIGAFYPKLNLTHILWLYTCI